MKVTVGDHVMSRHLAPDAKPWKCDGRIMRLAPRGEEMMAGTRQFAFAFFPGWAAGSVTGASSAWCASATARQGCTPPGGFSSCAGLLRWTLQASIGRLGGHLWWLASAPGPACFRDPIARAQGRQSPASRVQSTAGGRSAARSTGAMAAGACAMTSSLQRQGGACKLCVVEPSATTS